jgi:hypothetical protein
MSKKMIFEEVNAIWDRVDFAAAALLREMDDLLLEMQNARIESRRQFDARFIELNKRISEKSLAIMEQARTGNHAPHLNVVEAN